LQQVAVLATQVTLGLTVIGVGAGGLIAGQVAGQWLGAIVLIAVSATVIKLGALRFSAGWRDSKRLAGRYARFPRHLLLSHTLNALARHIPVFFISHISTAVLGLFSLAIRLLGVPFTLIGNSVAQVFLPEAARERDRTGSCVRVYLKVVKRLAVVACPIFVPILFVPEAAYTFVFGDQWGGLADVARALIPLFVVRFVASPVGSVFLICERTDIDLYFQIVFAGCSLASAGVGLLINSAMAYVYSYSIIMSIAYIANLALGYRIARYGSIRSS
jgi:O-antigen/teichoic acid export membrane protein